VFPSGLDRSLIHAALFTFYRSLEKANRDPCSGAIPLERDVVQAIQKLAWRINRNWWNSSHITVSVGTFTIIT
jgi:hypothetical protein